MKPDSLIHADATERPDLFSWAGPIDDERFARWLEANAAARSLPADLLELLKETGGGEMFESETILGVFGDVSLGDNIDVVNKAFHAEGMPSELLAFHKGIALSAFDLDAQDYVELDEKSLRVQRRFPTLNDWYRAVLRDEYAGRYGLEPLTIR